VNRAKALELQSLDDYREGLSGGFSHMTGGSVVAPLQSNAEDRLANHRNYNHWWADLHMEVPRSSSDHGRIALLVGSPNLSAAALLRRARNDSNTLPSLKH
jgi:hypothetical protein